MDSGKEASQIGSELRRIRTQKLQPLQPYPSRPDAFKDPCGFSQEMAFFVPKAFLPRSAQTLADMSVSSEDGANAKTALALLLRVMSQQLSGTPTGRAINGTLTSCSYQDTTSQTSVRRMKTSIYCQWMLADTSIVDPDGNKAMRDENIIGILFRALALDPLYDFDDALDWTLRENQMAQTKSHLRSITAKKHDSMAHMLNTMNELAEQCTAIDLTVHELFPMIVYPDRFSADFSNKAYKCMQDYLEQTKLEFLSRRKEDERMNVDVIRQVDLQAARFCEKQKCPEDKLHAALNMRRSDNTSEVTAIRNYFAHNDSPYVHAAQQRAIGAQCERVSATDAEREAFKTLSSLDRETVATSLEDYMRAIAIYGCRLTNEELDESSTPLQQLQSKSFSCVMLLPKCVSVTKCFTLKNALKQAQEAGASADQCDITHYYDYRFKHYSHEVLFDPASGERKDQMPVRMANRPMLIELLAPEFHQSIIDEIGEIRNDLLIAPFRAKHYLNGKYSAFLNMAECRLSHLEKLQFPWVTSDFPRRLEKEFSALMCPSRLTKMRINAMIEELRTYASNNKTPEDTGLFNGLERDVSQLINNNASAMRAVDPSIDLSEFVRQPSEYVVGNNSLVVELEDSEEFPANSSDAIKDAQERTGRGNRYACTAKGPGSKQSIPYSNPYKQLLYSKLVRLNTEQLREDMREMNIKMHVIRRLDPIKYVALVGDYRRHCLMEFARVYRSCAENNGDSMISMYSWQESHKISFHGSRMVSKDLTVFGNSMADAVRSVATELGVKVMDNNVAMQLIIRSNAFDLEPTRLNQITAGPTSCGKSANHQEIIDCSVNGTFIKVNSSSRQAGNDMSVQGLRCEFCEEAPNVINTGKADPRELDILNKVRTDLSEGVVCNARSNHGQFTQYICVSAPRVFLYGTNLLKINWKEPSLIYRLLVHRCRQMNLRTNYSGTSLVGAQFNKAATSTERSVCNDSVRAMWQHQQHFTSLYLHASNSFGLPPPCTLLLGALVPTIMRKIGGLVPNIAQYVRHAARTYAISRTLAVHNAWFARYCTPLDAFNMNDSTTGAHHSAEFDVMDLTESAPYAMCTMEGIMWAFFNFFEEIAPWHITPVLHAFAYRFGGFNPKSMDHLFHFDSLNTGHAAHQDISVGAVAQFKTVEVDGHVKVETFGTEPHHFGRRPEEMPEFWRTEEYLMKQIGMAYNVEWGTPSCEKAQFAETSEGRVNPNELILDYGHCNLADALCEVLERGYCLERNWITEVIDMFHHNCMLRLPKLRVGIAKTEPLEWETDDIIDPESKKVVCRRVHVEETRIFSQDLPHRTARINTVFLWLFRHRFFRMNALVTTEDTFTDPDERWTLPFPVPGEAGLLQAFVRKQQEGRFLELDNPFFIPSKTSSSGTEALSARWIANMMQAQISAYVQKRSENRLAIYNAQQLAVSDIHSAIRRSHEIMQNGIPNITAQGDRVTKSAFVESTTTDKTLIFRYCSPDDDAFLCHWRSEKFPWATVTDYLPTRLQARLRRTVSIMEKIEVGQLNTMGSAIANGDGDVLCPTRDVAKMVYPDGLRYNEMRYDKYQLISTIGGGDDDAGGGSSTSMAPGSAMDSTKRNDTKSRKHQKRAISTGATEDSVKRTCSTSETTPMLLVNDSRASSLLVGAIENAHKVAALAHPDADMESSDPNKW